MWVRTTLPLVALFMASLHAQERPLPDESTFFARVREKLESNEALQIRYSYKERRSELKLNPFGRMGTGPLLVYEVYPSVDPRMTYRRLVRRDGQPVSKTEIAEQDRAYREKYDEWRQDLKQEDEDERAAREKRRASNEAKLRAQAREVLDLFIFEVDRRETWHGQPAIVIRFRAKPDARPKTREARVAAVFTGEAWIHETEYELMHLEAHSTDDVSFGFGMVARLHEGAKTSVTRLPVNGVWLPSEYHFSGTGRALLFRHVTLDYSRSYFDYRPYDPTEPPPIAGLGSPESR